MARRWFRPGHSRRCNDLVVGDDVNEGAAWYYPESKEAAKQIAGYVAFWNGVTVEP